MNRTIRIIFLAPLLLLPLLAYTVAGQAFHLPPSDVDANARTEQDFLAFDPHYKEEKAQRAERARALARQVFEKEAAGQNTACSHQILFEAGSLLLSSADFKLLDRRLDDLEASLTHPEIQAKPESPDPSDGSWGACYVEWYLKVGASYDHLRKHANHGASPLPFPQYLDRVGTPEKLRQYLTSISASDIRKTGVDQEREFNDMLAVLVRMFVRGQVYTVGPKLKETLMDSILHRFRNPQTGWWGESYVRNGHVEFVDNLSITFHLVSYLDGQVPEMPQVIDTALAVKDLDYPVGWLWRGQYWNHNNMDVVTLFKYGWTSANDAQRRAMTAEIEKMLDWSLTSSLQRDGSFKPNLEDGSVEEGMEYGVAFLARIGYFDKSKRFWTSQDFPEATGVRARILSYIWKHQSSGGAGGTQYERALEDLGYDPAKDGKP
jgi:hypothetical protein